MKNKKVLKKMTLNKKTVANLGNTHMDAVKGGQEAPDDPTSYYDPACWYSECPTACCPESWDGSCPPPPPRTKYKYDCIADHAIQEAY